MKIVYSERYENNNLLKVLEIRGKQEVILIEEFKIENGAIELIGESFTEQLEKIGEIDNPLMDELIYYIEIKDSLGIVNAINKF